MVFDGRYKLIRGFDTIEKRVDAKKPVQEEPVLLFDCKVDPLENTNFAMKTPGQVERLTEIMNNTR